MGLGMEGARNEWGGRSMEQWGRVVGENRGLGMGGGKEHGLEISDSVEQVTRDGWWERVGGRYGW